jgi:hypothetical protein
MGQQEEFIFLFEFVETAEMVWQGRDLEGVKTEDSGLAFKSGIVLFCDFETFAVLSIYEE